MTLSVTLVTEREHIAQQWQQALTEHGIEYLSPPQKELRLIQ